eukprot:964528-Prorocentrum_lima.AAC.1
MRFALYVHEEKLLLVLTEAAGSMQQAAACPPSFHLCKPCTLGTGEQGVGAGKGGNGGHGAADESCL